MPHSTKLAIINCKSSKVQWARTAEALYMKSKIFRVQLELIKEYYDDYIILSSGYGVVYPTDNISTYNVAMCSGPRMKTTEKILNAIEKEQWADRVISNDIWARYDKLHFHISRPYWDPIKLHFAPLPNVTYVRQQTNPGLIILRYQEALAYLKETGELDLSIISHRRVSTDPEIARWFHHPTHGKFFGFARNLVKEYPEVDEGNLCRVSRGLAKQTRGWVRDESYLSSLKYNEEKNQWRISK